MKRLHLRTSSFIIGMLAMFLAGGARAASTGTVITSIQVTPASATVTLGGTLQYTAVAYDSFGMPVSAAINWSATNGNSMTASGLFTAKTVGAYTVTASILASSGTLISGQASGTVTSNGSTLKFSIHNRSLQNIKVTQFVSQHHQNIGVHSLIPIAAEATSILQTKLNDLSTISVYNQVYSPSVQFLTSCSGNIPARPGTTLAGMTFTVSTSSGTTGYHCTVQP